jgi:hypothetical protein
MTIEVPDEDEATVYKSITAGADVFVRDKPRHCK